MRQIKETCQRHRSENFAFYYCAKLPCVIEAVDIVNIYQSSTPMRHFTYQLVYVNLRDRLQILVRSYALLNQYLWVIRNPLFP